jgi:hypothetical protein
LAFVFTDYNNMVGKRPRQLYWKELQDAINSLSGSALTQLERDKLTGIETGATADMTPAEVKVAYESNLDTNPFSNAEKLKLVGIESGANKYIHPATHPAQMIVQDTNYRMVSDTEKAIWSDKYTRSEVDNKFTVLLSNLDWRETVATVADLASLTPENGWTVEVIEDNYTYRYNGSQWIPISANSIPLVTTLLDGKMSKGDKIKLDGVEDNATRDMTDFEIRDAYERNSDRHAFTDTLLDKLNNIAAFANLYVLPIATSTVLGGIKSGVDITIDGIGNVSVNDNSHLHTIANVTGLQAFIDAYYIHTHPMTDIIGLAAALAAKADSVHTHIISDTTGLQTALNSKSDISHTHAAVSSTDNGFMSSFDKVKLDGLSTNQNMWGSIKVGANTITASAVADIFEFVEGAGISLTPNNESKSMTITLVFNDTMHGARSGGSLHDVATPTIAGFLSAADKTKLDTVAVDAINYTLGDTRYVLSSTNKTQWRTKSGITVDFAAPTTPAGDDLWFDQGTNKIRSWNGSVWLAYDARNADYATQSGSAGNSDQLGGLLANLYLTKAEYTASTGTPESMGAIATDANSVPRINAAASLPPSAETIGTVHINTANKLLYRWNGTTWDVIGGILDSPTFTGITSASSLVVTNILTANANGVQLGKGTGTLTNGSNHNVAVSSNASYMTFTGPTSVYSVTGFANPVNGRVLIVYFNIAQTLTLSHDSANSLAGQRLTLPNGDMTFAANKPVRCIFVYDQSVGGGVGYWVLYSAIDGVSNGTSGTPTTINHIYTTSTEGQTTFAISGGYTIGMINMYMTGVKLRNSIDFTATDGLNVVLTSSVTAGKEIEFEILGYVGVLPEVTSVNGRTGDIILTSLDVTNALTYTPTTAAYVDAANALKQNVTNTLSAITVDGTIIGDILIAPMAVSCSVYDLLYLSSTGYNRSKGDADGTVPCVAMCIETGTGSRQVLKKGYVRNNAWTWTAGQLLYVSPGTAGLITSTLPSTTGNRVQIIGYAESATVIYFNPDYTFIQV